MNDNQDASITGGLPMNDSKISTYAEGVVAAVATTIVIAVVLAVIYVIFRSMGWLGLNWG